MIPEQNGIKQNEIKELRDEINFLKKYIYKLENPTCKDCGKTFKAQNYRCVDCSINRLDSL